MRFWLSRFKLLSTGRSAIAMPAMILYLPISFLFAYEREVVLSPGSLSDQLKIVLAGELTSFLFLHISSITLLRKRKVRNQNIFLCIFVWSTTGLIRGYFAEYYATSILHFDSQLSKRLLASVIYSLTGLALSAYLFGSIYEIETKKKALRSLNSFLSKDNSNLDSKQIEMKQEAILTLQKTLIPRVIKLQQLAKGLTKIETSKVIAASLVSMEEQAHRLVYQMRVNLDNLESIPKPRTKVTSRLFSSQSLNLRIWPAFLSVKLSFLFLLFGGAVVQLGRNSFAGVTSAALASIFIGLFLFVLDLGSKKATKTNRSIINICAYLSIFIFQYIYASRIVPNIFNLNYPLQPWYSSVKIIMAVYLASLFVSYLDADNVILRSMSTETDISRNTREISLSKNEKLESVNESTNKGVLQGQISGVLMALNILVEREDTNIVSQNLSAVINNSNRVLNSAISEIQSLSVRELLN